MIGGGIRITAAGELRHRRQREPSEACAYKLRKYCRATIGEVEFITGNLGNIATPVTGFASS